MPCLVDSAGARYMKEQLELRLPTRTEEQEFVRAHRATSPEVPYFLHFYRDDMPFRDYLELLAEQRRGTNSLPDRIPSTFLFAFVGPRIVGRVSIRHWLNESFERVGGHIGYVVVPEFRRRGYATEILRQALDLAREQLNIRRVLLTCDDDNVGSIRTIEKNAGQLADVITGPELSKSKRRYWITSD
jgi:predicted acetyltransferase